MLLKTTIALLLVYTCVYAQQNAQNPSSDPYTCSPSKPCKIGCCGKSGVCGLGPTFCAAGNCTSSCDSKSECDPGWGAQWSSAEKCPLNVCCSQYGFCGTTSEFCGSSTIKAPSCPASANSAAGRVIGYYESWSTTRACQGLYPEDLQYNAYTHLNYAFAFIDPQSFAIAPMQDLDKQLWPRFTALKQLNPGLQTWISIGGWSMNDPDQPTHSTFSTLAGSAAAQKTFFTSLVNFLSTYGFDGVDIDWEYPVAPERSGNPADFANYVSFLKNLKNALGSAGHPYGLTITIPSSYWYMRNFDIVQLEPIVDWFNVMTYDLHGTWDSSDPYIGPVVNSHTNLTEIDQTMQLLWRNNIDPKKVTMGTGFYGRSFTLSDPSCTSGGCPFSAGGNPGPCTASAGTLSYAEIEAIVAAGATTRQDNASASIIVTWDSNQWVSYDNPATLQLKMQYANSHCLGGVMVWAASTDDSNGTAIQALIGAAGRTSLSLAQQKRTNNAIDGQCVWSNCDGTCPANTQAVAAGSGKSAGFVAIFNECPSGANRKFCCPTGNPPQCTWRGSAPFCNGKCHSGEVEIASDLSGGGHSCWTGHKVLCCTNTATDTNYQSCDWRGAAPICATWNAFAEILRAPLLYYNSYSCPSDFSNKVTTGKYGYGGEQPCSELGGFKSFCCKSSNVWQNCKWHGARGSWTEWAEAFYYANPAGLVANLFGINPFLQDCTATCPSGQVTVATDKTDCAGGTFSVFCCDDPNVASLPQPPAPEMCNADISDLPNTDSKTDSSGYTDGNPADFFESSYYDINCGATADDGLGDQNFDDIFRRAPDGNEIDPVILFEDEYDILMKHGYLDTESGLIKRQNKLPPLGVPLKVCSGGRRQRVLIGTIARFLWPHVNDLEAAGQRFISPVEPRACARTELVLTTRQNGVEYDTEHMFPQSMYRNSIEFMIRGVYPNGTALPQGPVPSGVVTRLFGTNGAFTTPWNQLPGSIRPSFGNSPDQTAGGVLGTRTANGVTGNFQNLAILERRVNGLRGVITNRIGFTNPGNVFQTQSPLQQVARLRDAVLVFDYYRRQEVMTGFGTSFVGLRNNWRNFGTAVNSITNYDFVGAFDNIIAGDLREQGVLARIQFANGLQQAINFWSSPAAAQRYGSFLAAENLGILRIFQNNYQQWINVDSGSLMNGGGTGSKIRRDWQEREKRGPVEGYDPPKVNISQSIHEVLRRLRLDEP